MIFCDLTGSTSLAERLDPESVSHIMGRYSQELRAALERHGGTVEKFIGDAVMAVFGVPTAHEDDALRALRAVADMKSGLDLLNEELEERWGVRLQTRTGVNTGEVVIRDPSRGEGFVVGDTVNVAARLEQAASPGQVLLGSETYELVRDAVTAKPVEPLKLKGKTEPVPAFRLVEVADAQGVARRLDSPMVGREEELELLLETFERAVSGNRCELVTVLGGAGVGKSRLTRELTSILTDRATVLRGRCLPYGEGITYWPVSEIVREAARIDDQEPPETARAKVAALLFGESEGGAAAGALGAALGLSESTFSPEETFRAVRKLLGALARDRPLLVVFDDIHWGEQTFLDLVEYLENSVADVPALILCLARPELRELRPSLAGEGTGAVLALEPLGQAESVRLIQNLLGQMDLAQDVSDRITDAAGGNPLFVEEMLRMLVDEGILRREDKHWRAVGDASKLRVPVSIEALLAARLDLLTPEERDTLARASVIGEEFWPAAVSEIDPADNGGDVSLYLEALTRKEFVLPGGRKFAGEDAFTFRHILIRDAAYGGLLKESRSSLHQSFAEWLKRKLGERSAEYDEIIGYHFEQAYRFREQLGSVDDKARDLASEGAGRLGSAGRRAYARGDMPASVKLLERAVGLAPPAQEEQLTLMLNLGLALFDVGQLAVADEMLTEMAEIAAAIGDRRLELRALVERSSFRVWTNPATAFEDLRRVAEEAIPLFEQVGDDAGLARAWRNLADLHLVHAHTTEYADALQRALPYARRVKDKHTETGILAGLAGALLLGSTPAEEAISRLKGLVDQAKAGPVWRAAIEAWCLAELEAMRGEVEKGRLLCQQAQSIFEEFGQSYRLTDLGLHAAKVELLGNDPATAETKLRSAYDTLTDLGEETVLSTVTAHLAEALYLQGKYDDAERFAGKAEKLASSEDKESQVLWRATRAKVMAQRGGLEEGERLAREAVDLAEETDFPITRAGAFVALGEALGAGRRHSEAADAFQRAIELYEAKGDVVEGRRAKEMLERLELEKQESAASR